MIELLIEMGNLKVEFGVVLVEVANLCLQESDGLGLVCLVYQQLLVLQLELGDLLLQLVDGLVRDDRLVADDVDRGFARAVGISGGLMGLLVVVHRL
jgi:hypothetical protein